MAYNKTLSVGKGEDVSEQGAQDNGKVIQSAGWLACYIWPSSTKLDFVILANCISEQWELTKKNETLIK